MTGWAAAAWRTELSGAEVCAELFRYDIERANEAVSVRLDDE